ncbi:5'-methylthioadenosine/adenosylhomocysteine nucleosidase [Sedimentibacter sp. zth1]|uniref:5'-methylthioadenosine/adenosylhomocysteine nucleosidase n=1 Tax=Sedimentibacter sp. zth1 TaxID=2816908 RepID=UPI001A920EA6|nr:5'-methylthioadenosine/adenosylhomocysteine nucleosidase [Sedimentibacter sp. zth1]QSX06879.1 5'-methylthioadenosine/adenosylhomocysteine nucleosidase [Sedimentibacter sp. zth1]
MKNIGIIGAMQEEVAALIKYYGTSEKVNHLDFEFNIINHNDKKIVVVVSGIGKVNSAICTQLLIDRFKVDCVVNTGIAGAISEKLNIADVVFSTDLLQHDVNAVGFGYKLGEIPRMGENYIFKANKEILDKITKIAENNNMTYYVGRIVSGDEFVSTNIKKQWIKENFDAMCTDMESASIAHVCFLNKVPFMAIRCISDTSDDRATMVYNEFEKIALEKCFKISSALIEEL